MLFFPLDIENIKDFERVREEFGLPYRKSLPIQLATGMQMFRDQKQMHVRMDTIVKKYLYYSRDAIVKQIKKIDNRLTKIMLENHVPGVERYNTEVYHAYLASEEWDNKKEAMIFPTGPFDLCWDCHRPISLATAELHHVTYKRLGKEIWTDLRPLCTTCHQYRHPDKVGLPADIVNPLEVVTIPDVVVLEEYKSKKALKCLINGRELPIPKFAIKTHSEIKQEGDIGTLVISRNIAVDKGLIN
jgi:hypothetical protein